MNVDSGIKKKIYKQVKDAWLMQVATSSDNLPWIATVYFVADTKLNFYWLSYPNRRHSRELTANNRVAIAIAVKHDKPVIGIQAEGTVSEVSNIKTLSTILPKYIKKYGAGQQFLALTKKGVAQHRLYRFKPDSLQLFDEFNYNHKQNPIKPTFKNQ